MDKAHGAAPHAVNALADLKVAAVTRRRRDRRPGDSASAGTGLVSEKRRTGRHLAWQKVLGCRLLSCSAYPRRYFWHLGCSLTQIVTSLSSISLPGITITAKPQRPGCEAGSRDGRRRPPPREALSLSLAFCFFLSKLEMS